MTYLNMDKLKKPLELPVWGDAPPQVHMFDEKSVLAINAAIAAKRPLLLRGEPGTGKTQLARAAAKALGWAFIFRVIDSRSESSDLLYTLDAVSRLGEAQITGSLGKQNEKEVRELLAERRFVQPGPIWWAFNWQSALDQANIVHLDPPEQPDKGDPDKGCVLLIDEIDKADADLPNGLLDAFGSGSFQVKGLDKPVPRSDNPLLMIITTNEERALPDAFQRRCLVLQLKFEEGEKLIETFVLRGRAHFPEKSVSKKVLTDAATQVLQERTVWRRQNLAAPGLAEFLDLVRAVSEQESSEKGQLALLGRIKQFVLKKHPEV